MAYTLNKKEAAEWRSLQAKSKRSGVKVRRANTYTANVVFGNKNLKHPVYAQLGTGTATMVMNARITVAKMRGVNRVNREGRVL